MKNDFKPVVDHRFNLRADWGAVDCQVLAVEPNKTLSYTWAAYGLESVVTWTLTPTSTGTHLRMEQSGFRPDQQQAYQGAKDGWQQFFATLEQVLARTDLKSAGALVLRGGIIELEDVGSADPPLAVHRVYGGRHRQHRRLGAGATSRLGGSFGAAPARLAPAHRSVLVRAAVCREVAQRARRRRIGVTTMAGRAHRSSAGSIGNFVFGSGG